MSLTTGNTKRHSSIAFVRGSGALLWAADGSDYLDLTCAYGPIVLGYGHEEVDEAVKSQLSRGTLFPWATPEVDELSDQLLTIFPRAGACLFFKTGSEGVAAAVRLARAATGRTCIVRSGFHGWHDAFISPFYHWHDPDGIAQSGTVVPGIPATSNGDWLTWDGRNIGDLEQLMHLHGSKVAAILIDPVQYREPLAERLRAVREIASRHGTLLIHDEIKTGFRTSLRGVQGLYGIDAEMTVVSKALGNGFPIAAVICPKEVADFAATAKVKGTFNSELLSVAAARAVLRVLERENVAEKLYRAGEMLLTGFNDMVTSLGLEDGVRAIPYRWPCMPHVMFSGTPAVARFRADRYAEALLRERVIWLPNHMNYISLPLAYENRHIDRFITASARVLQEAARAEPTDA